MPTVTRGIAMSNIAIGLSLLLLIVVLPAMYNPKKFKEAIEDFLNAGNSMMRISGVFLLFIALFILNTNRTVMSYSKVTGISFTVRNAMALLGYIIAIHGISRLWFPELIRAKIRKVLQKDSTIYFFAIIGLVVALGLGYIGYFGPGLNWL